MTATVARSSARVTKETMIRAYDSDGSRAKHLSVNGQSAR
jgi:hypothetical protein